jgi:N-formylglutamate amidohydrolase
VTQKFAAPPPSVVLHIPHSGTRIPRAVRDRFKLSEAQVAAELLAMTDWFTDELFTTTLPTARVVYPVSRLVVDPERFVDDAAEVMAVRGMGVIYTKTSRCESLRDAPTPTERTTLLDAYYAPHHNHLTRAVDVALAQYSTCLVIDCHSFASTALPYELHQDHDRPDICLGTDLVHTPPALFEKLAADFMTAGFTVCKDRPFSGTLVPAVHYGTNPRVTSIMIELNRGLYMDEATGVRAAGFSALQAQLQSMLDELVEWSPAGHALA